ARPEPAGTAALCDPGSDANSSPIGAGPCTPGVSALCWAGPGNCPLAGNAISGNRTHDENSSRLAMAFHFARLRSICLQNHFENLNNEVVARLSGRADPSKTSLPPMKVFRTR